LQKLQNKIKKPNTYQAPGCQGVESTAHEKI
jgi:hypothetical protein